MIALRRALQGLGVVALVFGLLIVVLIFTSDYEEQPVADMFAVLVIGWGFIGTGLFAWWRRPNNPIGQLMVLTGFFWMLNGLTASGVPGLFIIGVSLASVSFGTLIHMLLAFPDGKLETRLERLVVVGGYVIVTVMQIPGALLYDPSEDSTCKGCPPNPILIDGHTKLLDACNAVQALFAVALIAGLIVALVRRQRRWSTARKRAFAPVLIAGGLTLGVAAVQLVVGLVGGDDQLQTVFFIALLFPFAAVPFAFLAGLLASRISRAGAVSELVAGLARSGERQLDLRDQIAEALADPSVQLAYWVPERDGYIDADGHPFGPDATDEHSWTEVEHDGRRVGAIIHDSTLDDAEDMVDTVAAAAGLSMENERLEAELRARLEELQESRRRIVEAGYEQRRRLERDLHDGAQQRLLALALNLRLVRSRLDTDPAEAGAMLDEAATELGEATIELRELARGIHPAVLTDRGLGEAVNSLAGRAPLDVSLDLDLDERLPDRVEAAAYFVISEALTNVARHADVKAARVSAAISDGDLVVEVSDDGRGGADAGGSGLAGLADRVAALDGRLQVGSSPGTGTTVRAQIPCR